MDACASGFGGMWNYAVFPRGGGLRSLFGVLKNFPRVWQSPSSGRRKSPEIWIHLGDEHCGPFCCDTTDSPRGGVGNKVVLPVDQVRGARSVSGVTSIFWDFGSLHQKPRVRGTHGCVSDGWRSPVPRGDVNVLMPCGQCTKWLVLYSREMTC